MHAMNDLPPDCFISDGHPSEMKQSGVLVLAHHVQMCMYVHYTMVSSAASDMILLFG